MLLCLDVGNTQIYGGVFSDNNIKLRFRYDSKTTHSSDQHGIFLKSLLREQKVDMAEIDRIAICSVVPSLDYSLRGACIKYFGTEPFFLKASGSNLDIKYDNPMDVGADRIANAMAATAEYPNQNIVIVDFGTATTVCVISKHSEYLGGVIMPGIALSMNALKNNTAKLFPVEIIKPKSMIGTSTTTSLQSGLYYSQLATVQEIIRQVKSAEFKNEECMVIGSGGFAHLFADQEVFSVIMPDLVLYGLKIALNNQHA